jgi:hypothetical protein
LFEQWWTFSGGYGGVVGTALFWWTVLTALLFILSSVAFVFCGRPGRCCLALPRWGFPLLMALVVTVQLYVVVRTWRGVWVWLYDMNHSWTAVQQEEQAFVMWRTAICLAVLSSSLWACSLILLKPQTAANQMPEDTSRKRADPQH